jgi:hypothetical protein
MDTVRIEMMLVGPSGQVLQNWTTMQGSVENNPQVYIPRAVNIKSYQGDINTARVRVVSEQTNRIVDIIQ